MFHKIIIWIKDRSYKHKMKKFIKYYRSRPDKFCEDFLGIKLYDYQKTMLREVVDNE